MIWAPFRWGIGPLASLFIGTALIISIITGIAVWVYLSFAYTAIGKKAKLKNPELAWIPVVGPLIVTSKAAKMHWWPILLLIGFWIPVLNSILYIVVTVFATIWLWKTFELINKPGWWALLCLIPIVNLVLLGVAAWGD